MPTTPPPLPIWHSHIGYTKSIVIIKFLKILKICSKQQKSWWFYMYLHSKDERSKNVNENNTYTWNQFSIISENSIIRYVITHHVPTILLVKSFFKSVFTDDNWSHDSQFTNFVSLFDLKQISRIQLLMLKTYAI